MTCVICGRRCTPMADYDVTVCIACDELMAVVLAVGPQPRHPAAAQLDLFARLRAQLAAA